MPKVSACLLVAALLAAPLHAEIDRRNFDISVDPAADFYRYVNGTWLKGNPVPPDRTHWGSFDVLAESNLVHLRDLCEAAAKNAQAGEVEREVGDFYASGMDEAAIEAAGLAPLQPELDRIAALSNRVDLLREAAHLHSLGVSAGFDFFADADAKKSSQELAQLCQGGLGLPERDYYFRDDAKSKAIRDEYVAHIGRTLQLAGEIPDAAGAEAARVMALETAMAKASLTLVVLRNPYASYHNLPLANAAARFTPNLDWSAYLKEAGAPPFQRINFAHPDFFKALDRLLSEVPVGDWKAYFKWHLLASCSPYLSRAFVDENFRFQSALDGQQELAVRWKRVVRSADALLGDALGQLYVGAYFPPEAKTRILVLVGDLKAALGERIESLEWMDDATKARAMEKLTAMAVKMGYPDVWKDYRSAKIDRGPYVLNVLRARAYEVRRNLAKIGGPVDRKEWYMTPPTANAYYDPSKNEIVFPAGILQPPFFDAHGDDGMNYGGIGAVIGHEMTHGFDDQGRQYDADGNLQDWWSPASAGQFRTRAAKIAAQFNGYAVDDLHVNGELTQGENIADLGGVKIAYTALESALAGKPRPSLGGFTPEQRFFISFGTIWRERILPKAARNYIFTDPHSPDAFRCNGPLSNLDEFAAAFGIPEGAPMRRPAADRVVIW